MTKQELHRLSLNTLYEFDYYNGEDYDGFIATDISSSKHYIIPANRRKEFNETRNYVGVGIEVNLADIESWRPIRIPHAFAIIQNRQYLMATSHKRN